MKFDMQCFFIDLKINLICSDLRSLRKLIKIFFSAFFHFVQQKWEQKAVEAKEEYGRKLKTFEANGGGKDTGAGKKRSKGGRAKPAKKGKKKADSDDDDEDESDQIISALIHASAVVLMGGR